LNAFSDLDFWLEVHGEPTRSKLYCDYWDFRSWGASPLGYTGHNEGKEGENRELAEPYSGATELTDGFERDAG
jgi:hypothetical protein